MKIKRVIEIEEDTLKRIDEARSIPDMFGADIVNGLNAIKNGTSITELSDNIFANILLSEINKKGLAFEEVLLLIDNAPTVEEKSQGEWIFNPDSIVDDMVATHFCSICGRGGYSSHDNYCWYCGADMRKGGAE